MNNIISLFPDYLNSDSLFQKMVPLGAPWASSIGKSMDLSYFAMYSGIKQPTFFVRTTMGQNQVANSQLLAQTLWDIYGKNWSRLWEDYVSVYNPIENYNLNETVERDQTDDSTIGRKGTLSSVVDTTSNQDGTTTGTSSLEHGHIIDTTDERNIDNTSDGTSEVQFGHVVDTTDNKYTTTAVDSTSSLQHGQIISNQNTLDQSRYGFNSTEQVPTDTQTEGGSQTHSGTDTTTDHNESTVSDNDTITQTNSGTDKTITHTESTTSDNDTTKQTNSGTDTTNSKENTSLDVTSKDTRTDTTTDDTTATDTISETITRKRSGNIGVTTTQDMLLQDFELWKWNFFFQVFEDCDKFLCLSVIDDCQFS